MINPLNMGPKSECVKIIIFEIILIASLEWSTFVLLCSIPVFAQLELVMSTSFSI